VLYDYTQYQTQPRAPLVALCAAHILRFQRWITERQAIIGDDNFRGAPSITHYPSWPFPERFEGNDAQTWIEPTAADRSNYMNYFQGNQLPGTFLSSGPMGYPVVQAVQVESLVRPQGSFGPNLGQVGIQNLVARWQGIWQSASSS
jgi:hypothetical protein